MSADTFDWSKIIERLLEYHNDVAPDAISEAALDRAWAQGYKDPCGCVLCQLMQKIVAIEIANAGAEGVR